MKKYICYICMILCCLTMTGCLGPLTPLLQNEMEDVLSEPETETETYDLVEEKAYVLKDGTVISLWQPSFENTHVRSYRLPGSHKLLDVFLETDIDGVCTEDDGDF